MPRGSVDDELGADDIHGNPQKPGVAPFGAWSAASTEGCHPLRRCHPAVAVLAARRTGSAMLAPQPVCLSSSLH